MITIHYPARVLGATETPMTHVYRNTMLEESKNNQIWKCCQIAVNLYFGSFRSLELPYNKNLSLTSTSAEN